MKAQFGEVQARSWRRFTTSRSAYECTPAAERVSPLWRHALGERDGCRKFVRHADELRSPPARRRFHDCVAGVGRPGFDYVGEMTSRRECLEPHAARIHYQAGPVTYRARYVRVTAQDEPVPVAG